MPSPYLDGLFDKLTLSSDETFEAPIESVRGCPYQCTFCEIGDKYFQKIARQSNKKVFLELFVKVIKNWRDNEQDLKRFGYYT